MEWRRKWRGGNGAIHLFFVLVRVLSESFFCKKHLATKNIVASTRTKDHDRMHSSRNQKQEIFSRVLIGQNHFLSRIIFHTDICLCENFQTLLYVYLSLCPVDVLVDVIRVRWRRMKIQQAVSLLVRTFRFFLCVWDSKIYS